jgi:N-acetylglucosamine-6-sulfatase
MQSLFTLGLVTLATQVAASGSPNIVVILTDDQDLEMGSLQYMPFVQSLLVSEGATFQRFYAAVPVCCPSRSTLFSGQYQHNNHVVGNEIASNCSSPAWQAGPESRNFGVYLQAAGYKTSFAGKYLNCYGFPQAGGVAHVPPGWSNWQGLVGNSIYYNYTSVQPACALFCLRGREVLRLWLQAFE